MTARESFAGSQAPATAAPGGSAGSADPAGSSAKPVRRPGNGGLGLGRRCLLGLGGLAALLALWWLGTDVLSPVGGMARRFSPGATFVSLAQLLTASDLPMHILVSLRRIAVGLGFALLIGVPLGLAIGSWRRLEAAVSPAMQFLRMISPLSWMPIAVMV
ncbi:ABC transporter permease, partial [Achromobacter sp.]|uniref:ABC transporter permease n=1 Tax=Achromobacter sp. TaxID=134375 RepID=UPI003918273A